MKNVLRIIVLVCFGSSLFAQQIPLTSHYMFNEYLLNPAVAGSKDYTLFALTARSQWVGLDGSPKTQFFSGQTKLGEKMGIGGFVYNDQSGPINESGLQLSYAYHLTLNEKSKLSFGLAGMFASHHISKATLKPEENGDPAIDNLINKGYVGDVNFGVLYYTDKYKVGLSSTQLLQNNLYAGEGSLARHYNLYGDYQFDISDNIALIPSTLVKYVPGAPLDFDLSTRGVYKEKYWVGVSYRYNNAIVALAGLTYKNLMFGYAYDYTLTDIGSIQTGGHEIFISYKMFKAVAESSRKFD